MKKHRNTPADNYSGLPEKISRLAEVHALCAGDVMLDRFIYGDVTRISPEAPIPVLQVTSEQSMLGGAGNVVRNLCSLGARVSFAGVAGNDSYAGEIAAFLDRIPTCEATLVRERNRSTSVKHRYISQGQQLLRADCETIAPIAQDTLEQLLDLFRAALRYCHVVVLSDYGKGVLSGDNAQCFIDLANAAGQPVLVDPKGLHYSRYKNAAIIKPNLKELAEATGMPVDTEEAIAAAARKVLTHTNAKAVVVTRGPAGMMLVPADGAISTFSSQAREVFDVSGAGDTCAASLALAVGAGISMQESVYLANVAASLVVAKVGTAVVEQEELRREVKRRELSDSANHFCSVEVALDRARSWTANGLKVGLVTGVFDSIGHAEVALLQHLRGRCDRLIVVVIDEDEVKLVKPPLEIQAARSRATVLSSMSPVDLVLIHPKKSYTDLFTLVESNCVCDFSDPSCQTAASAST
jgi:D-beta-D-heptose 7-phosphate kinase/D-beta-D-heptose 1-phosphate adenosyltransferase